jgi:2-haloacid dehalogenase
MGTASSANYAWILLDADGTLFDYDRAEAAALATSFADLDLPWEPDYLQTYRRINGEHWLALERGETTPDRIKVGRFEDLFEAIGCGADAADFSRRYLARLAGCRDLIDGADFIVARLARSSRLVVITNGLPEVQRPRIAGSPLEPYLADIIISEEVGSAKPEPGIFEAAFAAMGDPAKHDVLMVGDSLTSDIAGGNAFGIDTCWFNPGREPSDLGAMQPTFTISRLEDLLDVVGSPQR